MMRAPDLGTMEWAGGHGEGGRPSDEGWRVSAVLYPCEGAG